jgi:hypothetical protein
VQQLRGAQLLHIHKFCGHVAAGSGNQLIPFYIVSSLFLKIEAMLWVILKSKKG